MKTIIYTVIIFLSGAICSKTNAQGRLLKDTVYYLVDTAKTPVNDRMWDIHLEYPSLKVYTIQCGCLKYHQQPTFVYSLNIDKGIEIQARAVKTLKLVSLPVLISKAQQFADTAYPNKPVFFFIEPVGKKFIYHQMRLIQPSKQRGPSIDYESIPPVDTAKHKKY